MKFLVPGIAALAAALIVVSCGGLAFTAKFLQFSHAMTLPQVAMVAALIGDGRPDPWCEPSEAAEMRHRILERMRNNGAIDPPTFEAADRSELGLAPPLADHQPCKGEVPPGSLTRN